MNDRDKGAEGVQRPSKKKRATGKISGSTGRWDNDMDLIKWSRPPYPSLPSGFGVSMWFSNQMVLS